MANIRYRKAQQILRDRRNADRRHSLASHAIRAGLSTEDAKGIAGGLRTQIKKQGIVGRTSLTSRTIDGRCKGRKRLVTRYTRAQVLCAALTYKPRKASYVAARDILVQELTN